MFPDEDHGPINDDLMSIPEGQLRTKKFFFHKKKRNLKLNKNVTGHITYQVLMSNLPYDSNCQESVNSPCE